MRFESKIFKKLSEHYANTEKLCFTLRESWDNNISSQCIIKSHLLDGYQLFNDRVHFFVVRVSYTFAPGAMEVRPLFLDKQQYRKMESTHS